MKATRNFIHSSIQFNMFIQKLSLSRTAFNNVKVNYIPIEMKTEEHKYLELCTLKHFIFSSRIIYANKECGARWLVK